MFNNFSLPNNNGKEETLLYLQIGIITDIDTENYHASVSTNHGIRTNVRICFPHYSGSTGIFIMPSIGDVCAIGITSENEAYMLAFYSLNPKTEKDTNQRIVPNPHTYIIRTLAGDKIQISLDSTTSGTYIFSPKTVDLTVKNGKIINKGQLEDKETSSMTFDVVPGIINFTVKGGDGSPLVTQKQMQSVVDNILNIINNLILPVSGAVAGPPNPPRPTVTVPGVVGLQTTEAKNSGAIASSIDIPEDIANNPEVIQSFSSAKAADESVKTAEASLKSAQDALASGKSALKTATDVYETAVNVMETAKKVYMNAGGRPDPKIEEISQELVFRTTLIGASAYAVFAAAKLAFETAKNSYLAAQNTFNSLVDKVNSAQQNFNSAVQEALKKKELLENTIKNSMK